MTDAWLWKKVRNERKIVSKTKNRLTRQWSKDILKETELLITMLARLNAESKFRKRKKILGKIPNFEGRIIEKWKDVWDGWSQTNDWLVPR